MEAHWLNAAMLKEEMFGMQLRRQRDEKSFFKDHFSRLISVPITGFAPMDC